jgi:glycosyltransferase involved in cell wall biosynthesis
MRVAMVLDLIISGGAENVCLDIINRFQQDFNFDFISISQSENANKYFKCHVNTYQLERKNKLNLFTAYQLHSKLSEFNIIHVHLRHTYRYVAWVKRVFRGKYKIILHDHEGKIYINENPPFPEFKFLKPDFYIGVCDKLVQWSETVWGMEHQKTSTLLNLPFVESKENNFTDDIEDFDYVLVGNIKTIKNQMFATNLIGEMNRKITFFGNNQENEYFHIIENSPNCKIVQNVNVNQKLLSRFKFGLCTSISESGPLVVMEYLMAGIPFLAYKVGGMSDAIAEYFPEYFIENFNREEWIDRIAEIENNPIPKEIYEERMNRLLEEKFNAEQYKAQLMEIYQSLI